MTGETTSSSFRTGVFCALAAYGMWGFLPLYFILVRTIPADEVLIARILFSVPFGAVIIAARGQFKEVWQGIRDLKMLAALTISGLVVASNWLVYIIAVQGGHIFEASLGYYINPLIYVLAGVVLLGERLNRPQLIAVGLAAIGVSILTVYGGKFPAVALYLAISFTCYGYIRKKAVIGAMPGLFIETLVLAPLAAIALGYFWTVRDTSYEAAGLGLWAILSLAGPVTVVPLLFFAMGARRLPLAVLGFLQFLGPTIQFVIALIEGEDFTRAHQICFAFIWTAAVVFGVDAYRRARKAKPPTPIPVRAAVRQQ